MAKSKTTTTTPTPTPTPVTVTATATAKPQKAQKVKKSSSKKETVSEVVDETVNEVVDAAKTDVQNDVVELSPVEEALANAESSSVAMNSKVSLPWSIVLKLTKKITINFWLNWGKLASKRPKREKDKPGTPARRVLISPSKFLRN